MKKEFLDLPGWEFEIHEESMGVYKMTGRSFLGHEVSATGVDPEALTERIRVDAIRITSQVPALRKAKSVR
jgi:hypothetical protein